MQWTDLGRVQRDGRASFLIQNELLGSDATETCLKEYIPEIYYITLVGT